MKVWRYVRSNGFRWGLPLPKFSGFGGILSFMKYRHCNVCKNLVYGHKAGYSCPRGGKPTGVVSVGSDVCVATLLTRQAEILETEDVPSAIMFAGQNSDADTVALESLVMSKGSIQQMVQFAMSVKSADVDAVQAKVLGSNDGRSAWMLASRIKGGDVEGLQDVVIRSRDTNAAYGFASSVKGADIGAMVDIAVGNTSYEAAPDFVRGIKGITDEQVESLREMVAEFGEDIHRDLMDMAVTDHHKTRKGLGGLLRRR